MQLKDVLVGQGKKGCGREISERILKGAIEGTDTALF